MTNAILFYELAIIWLFLCETFRGQSSANIICTVSEQSQILAFRFTISILSLYFRYLPMFTFLSVSCFSSFYLLLGSNFLPFYLPVDILTVFFAQSFVEGLFSSYLRVKPCYVESQTLGCGVVQWLQRAGLLYTANPGSILVSAVWRIFITRA